MAGKVKEQRSPRAHRYPRQLVVMTSHEQADAVRTEARHSGLSLSEVIRAALEIGLPEIERARAGRTRRVA